MTAFRGAEILYTDQFIPMFFTWKFGRSSKQDTQIKRGSQAARDKTEIRCHVCYGENVQLVTLKSDVAHAPLVSSHLIGVLV